MPDENKTESFEKSFLVNWMIWAAIFASLFIYVLICHLVADGSWRSENSDIPLDLLRNILFGVSIVMLFLARFLRRRILSVPQGNSMNMPSQPESGPNQAQFAPQYTLALIISCALSESIGIFGLVLFLLGDSFQFLYLFIGVSAIALFYFRPKREEIEKLVKTELLGGAISPDS